MKGGRGKNHFEPRTFTLIIYFKTGILDSEIMIPPRCYQWTINVVRKPSHQRLFRWLIIIDDKRYMIYYIWYMINDKWWMIINSILCVGRKCNNQNYCYNIDYYTFFLRIIILYHLYTNNYNYYTKWVTITRIIPDLAT